MHDWSEILDCAEEARLIGKLGLRVVGSLDFCTGCLGLIITKIFDNIITFKFINNDYYINNINKLLYFFNNCYYKSHRTTKYNIIIII
jgi:hypothetical protein